MEREYKVTPYQLYAILFLAKVVTMLTYSNKFSHSKSIWDYTISSICLFILSFILIAPTYFMYKKFPNVNIFEGKLGRFYKIAYGLYFVFVACYFLGMFKLFIVNVMTPYIPIFLLSLFTFLLAIYAANKGLHAIARTTVIILFVIIISLIFVYSSLFYKIDTDKFFTLFEHKSDTFLGVLYLFSRGFGLSVFPIIIPFIKGSFDSFKKTFLSWNLSTCFLTIFTVTLAVGALGDFLKTQDFPIYWSTKVAELGVFKRLDAIYIGVFVSGIFILISFFFYLFKFVCSNFYMKISRRAIFILGVMVVLIFGIILSDSENFNYFLYNTNILIALNILTSFLMPLIYFLKELYKSKKEAQK